MRETRFGIIKYPLLQFMQQGVFLYGVKNTGRYLAYSAQFVFFISPLFANSACMPSAA